MKKTILFDPMQTLENSLDKKSAMKYILVLVLLICFSCKTQKQKLSTPSDNIIQYSGKSYFINRLTDLGKCKLNKLSDEALIANAELNHEGDKDDKPPRKILVSQQEQIKNLLYEKFNNSYLEVKQCMNREGHIILNTISSGTSVQLTKQEENKILVLMSEYKYAVDPEAACMSCKTQSVRIKLN